MSVPSSLRNPSRRDAIKALGAAGVGLAAAGILRGQSNDIVIDRQPAEIAVFSVSERTVRITARPLAADARAGIPFTGALAKDEFGAALAKARTPADVSRVRAGNLIVRFTPSPPAIHIETTTGEAVQQLTLSSEAATMSFALPKGPLLGLGEGGVQFDRKGAIDPMPNGQAIPRGSGYALATHGTRAPIQWLIGAGSGWALFIHQPYGQFDFSGDEGRFSMRPPRPDRPADPFLPLDVFVVSSRDPAAIMREYAAITGFPEMPALWTLGYQQSHRTLEGREQILGIAKTMRDKKLPCDTLIYLGTEFAPSGWNTRNGEFTWHPINFPDPKAMLDELHAEHFKIVLHIVVEGSTLTGAVGDPCTAAPLPPGRTPDDHWPPDRQVSCYWPAHKPLMDVGVDGWWPDQGDGFDGPSRLRRHQMYWEGTQLYRPNERPYALHRNASAGIQRYGGFVWSGDVQSRWETLKLHVPDGINTSLSGLPLWGTDIGGFYGTTDFTGELFVRWFQFGAFCPLFRSHGRNWHLHLPWGWDGGDGGPNETQGFHADPDELHNKTVEPICRKYLELRYRLLPYLYTAMREAHDTGMPIMRALWLHAADDAAAAARGDEYFWGPDMIVAPVTEKGATSRRVYLPKGAWHDFWTEARVAGGREIDRAVDLETMPIYVRAGAVLPLGPVRQYTSEPTSDPLALVIYPGTDGASSLYEDDGRSFDYRTGAWMKIAMSWHDARRRLSLRLAAGSRMLAPARRPMTVRVAGSTSTREIVFTGADLDVDL